MDKKDEFKVRSPKARGLKPSQIDRSEDWLNRRLTVKDKKKSLFTLFEMEFGLGFGELKVELWPSGWACGRYYPEYGKINWDVRYRCSAKDAVEEWLKRGYDVAKDEFERYKSALEMVRNETEDGEGAEASEG